MNLREAAWKKTPEVDYVELSKDYPLATVVDSPDKNRRPRVGLSWAGDRRRSRDRGCVVRPELVFRGM